MIDPVEEMQVALESLKIELGPRLGRLEYLPQWVVDRINKTAQHLIEHAKSLRNQKELDTQTIKQLETQLEFAIHRGGDQTLDCPRCFGNGGYTQAQTGKRTTCIYCKGTGKVKS